MAFAIDPHQLDVAYALAVTELATALHDAQGVTTPADTKTCLD